MEKPGFLIFPVTTHTDTEHGWNVVDIISILSDTILRLYFTMRYIF